MSQSAARPVRVAVVREAAGSFQIEQAALAAPREEEVLVRIIACGMCHTDLSHRLRGPFPIVLGHEGAGVVEAVGAAVEAVGVGDHVVLSFLSCGLCPACRGDAPSACADFLPLNLGGARPDGSHALCDARGAPLHDRFFGQSAFASHALAHQRNVVKVRKDAPLEMLGPLGCGVLTGAGTVFNALKVGPGDSLAVFGAGAVGLSAVMAASVAGASTIMVCDRVPARLNLAQEVGATHVFNTEQDHPTAAIRETTGGGASHAIDTTAVPSVIGHMIAALGARGKAAIVGVSPPGTTVPLDVFDLMVNQKTVCGVVEGAAAPQRLIPTLVDLMLEGRFPLDRLIGYFDLDAINEAAASSTRGEVVKPVIRIGSLP